MRTIIEFFESLAYPFIQRSILTAIILSVLCAIIGIFVILREMVFLVDGIAHSAFAGGALSILLGINPILTIGGFGIITAVSMAYINEKGKLQNETAIGIVFAFTMALAIIFRSMFTQYTNGIDALLFGSIATVSMDEFIYLIIMAVAVLIIVYFIQKDLFFITMNTEMAKSNGIQTRKYSYIFLILVALVIMVSIRSIGVILLLALIVTPPAAAYQLTYQFNAMVKYSVIIAVSGSIIGYFLAFILNIAANAMIVCILTAIFLLSFTFSPKRRHFRTFIDDQFCATCDKIKQDNVACQFCDKELKQEERNTHGHNHHKHSSKNGNSK